MEFEVRVETVGRRYIATAQGRASVENLKEVAFPLSGQAWDFLKAHPEIPTTGVNIWVYWDDATGELFLTKEGLPFEPGAEVLEPFESDGAVVCSYTPGGTVARADVTGPYDLIPDAHLAIRKWVKENGHTLAGPNWEVYGPWNEDPTDDRCEVFYQLA